MQGVITHTDVDGRRMPCYHARPDGAHNPPGVVLLQEVFGVNAEMRRITDLLASAGVAAIAPNFYHRTHPDLDVPYNEEGIRIGIEAASATTVANLTADVQSATNWLLAKGCPKVGTWGFCFGGSLAYLSATFPEVSAAVSFYGGQIAKAASPARPPMITFTELIQAPLFLAFGAKDEGIPPEEVDAIRTALTEAHKKFELHVYPDVGHAFFRHGVNGDSSEAARDVWPKVREFLNKNLAP
jgi:carboxymethylenebutenolidase